MCFSQGSPPSYFGIFLPPAGDVKKRSREVQNREGNLCQTLGVQKLLSSGHGAWWDGLGGLCAAEGSWFLWLSHEREGDRWRSMREEAEMGRGQDVLFSFNRSDYQTLLRFVLQTAGTLLFQTHRSDTQIMLVNWIWAGSARMNCLLYVPEAEL